MFVCKGMVLVGLVVFMFVFVCKGDRVSVQGCGIGVCVSGVCGCLCLLNMKAHLMRVKGERACMILISAHKNRTHGTSHAVKGRKASVHAMFTTKEQKSRVDLKRVGLHGTHFLYEFQLFFLTLPHEKLNVQCFQHCCPDMLIFRVFDTKNHKTV